MWSRFKLATPQGATPKLPETGRIWSEVKSDVADAYARGGLPAATGQAIFGSMMIDQDARNKIAQSSRERAILAMQLAIENIRLAVQQSIAWRLQSVQAAAEYIRTLALGPEIGARIAGMEVDARARAAEVAASYFRSRVDAANAANNARIELEKLRYDPVKTTALLRTDLNKAFGTMSASIAQARSAVFAAAATSAGNQAAAALSQLNAIAQIQKNESI